MVIEKENLPELNGGFIKSLKVLGKVNAQIAHVNDDGIWEVGKLHKYKAMEIPAPTGGTVKVRHMFKLKNATRDQFFRLRKKQYGSAKHWVALAAKKPPSAAAAKAAKKAKPKPKPKPKAKSGGK